MSEFSINTQNDKTVLLSSRVAMVTARKLQEIKSFMVELGICQIWTSKRGHAHSNSK